MIQRRMKLGYNRAGRIMDQLEQLNIVEAADGSKPREIGLLKWNGTLIGGTKEKVRSLTLL